MSAPQNFDAAFSARAWGPAMPGDVTTVIFHRRCGPRPDGPDVSAPTGADDPVAQAEVSVAGGHPVLRWRQRPTSEEFPLREFEAAALREAHVGVPSH